MPEITHELHDALRKMEATAIVEEGNDDALVASVEVRLLRDVCLAIKADPAFAAPEQTWQERAAREIAWRCFRRHVAEESSLVQIVLAVLAESAPCASDPEVHAALLRLARAVGKWFDCPGESTEEDLGDAYDALPASVREEAGR